MRNRAVSAHPLGDLCGGISTGTLGRYPRAVNPFPSVSPIQVPWALLVAMALGCPPSEPPGQGSQGALVINEIVCARADAGPDWIELYVSGDKPVALNRYALRDDNPSREPAPLPEITLQPGEFLRIIAADKAPDDTSAWVPFGLGAGDAVTLSRDGEDIHTVDWKEGEAPEGTSYGLTRDGDVSELATLRPTPAAANERWEGALPEPLDLFVGDTVYPMALVLSSDDWGALTSEPLVEKWYRATLEIGPFQITEVGLRAKGVEDLQRVHGTETERFSFRVDVNRFVPGQRVDDRRGFELHNGYMDPTFMREVLAFEFYREVGLRAPKTQYVDLTVGGKHLGLYLLVELVDKEFLQDYFADYPDGDLFEPEPPAATLQWAGDTPAAYPKMGLETNEDVSDGAGFVALVDALASGAPQAVLDLVNARTYIAATAMLGNLDSYLGSATNYYLYEDNGQSRFRVIPWDVDQAFGTYDCGCDADVASELPNAAPTCGARVDRPLVDVLLGDLESWAAYRQLLQEWSAPSGSFPALSGRVATLQALIAPYVRDNPTKLFTEAEFLNALDEAVIVELVAQPGVTRSVPGLRSFITARLASVTAQLERSSSRSTTQGLCP